MELAADEVAASRAFLGAYDRLIGDWPAAAPRDAAAVALRAAPNYPPR